jgi:hypothetical protein
MHNCVDILASVAVAFLREDFRDNIIDIILLLHCLSITCYGVRCAGLMVWSGAVVAPLMAQWGSNI